MVRAQQYRMFWRDLNELLRHNATLSYSLRVVSGQFSKDDQFGKGVRKVAEQVRRGALFADALHRSGIFSAQEIDAVASAESPNKIKRAVSQLAQGRISGRADEYSSFYKTLALALVSKVDILSALNTIPIGVTFYDVAQTIRGTIIDGGTFSDGMEKSGMFSKFEITLVDLKEQTGILTRVMLCLAEY